MKRYNWWVEWNPDGTMKDVTPNESKNGDWVLWRDVKEILKKQKEDGAYYEN